MTTSPDGDDLEPSDVRLLVPALVAWAACAAALGLPPAVRCGLGAGCVLSLAGVWRGMRVKRTSRYAGARTGAALALTATSMCLAVSGLQGWWRDVGTLRPLAQAGAVVRLEARVAGDPHVIAAQGFGGDDLVLVRLAVTRVDGRGQRSVVRSRVLAFGDEDWLTLRWGARVEVVGRLAPSRPADDVVATLDARGPPRILDQPSRVARSAERLRAGLRRACEGLAPDPRGLLPGLVVGDTTMQPRDLGEAMRATGLTHLAAVSGTNITIVCVVVLGLGRAAGMGRRVRLVVTGVLLGGFVVLARPEPSVLRAAVMGGLGLLALGSGRRRAALPALSAAVVLLLVVDPWLARSYGFALSVLATAGLLLLGRPWSDALSRWLPRPVAVAVAVPLAAQAACGPVIVLLSAQISLVSLPANVIAAPLVAPATVLGLTAAVASPLSATVAAGLAHVAGWACAVVALDARKLAEVPGGQVAWPAGARGALLLAVATVAVLACGPWLQRRARARPVVALQLTATLLAVAVAIRVPLPGQPSWPPTGWVMVACDVGQGDALVLATGPGRAVLVDTGPEPDDVDGCLDRLGVQALDLVVLTHFHADHADGLPGALRGRRVGGLEVTLVDDPPTQARQVRAEAAAAGVPVRTVRVGEQARVGQVGWVVLGPERVIREGSVPNNASIVMLVEAAGLRLLLVGDVEPAAARTVARRLATLAQGPHVDVLKVAHHGSGLQDPQLIASAAPRLALISVGAGNDYGHPAPATLRLLAATGARVARTDLQGDLAVVHDAAGVRLVTSGPRPHRPHR